MTVIKGIVFVISTSHKALKKKKAEESKEIFNSCICFVYFCLAKKEVEFAKGKDEGMGGV